ncbi:MAG: HWE histidine kinase domain-containing protein [Rhodomicrobium sp.]
MISIVKKPGLNVWIVIVTGVIVLLIGALITLAILRAKQDAIAQAKLKASYLSAALQEEAEGHLESLGIAVEYVKRQVETEGAAAPLAELKAEISSYLPGVANIAVIGPDGSLRATSGEVTSAPLNFSHFDFFRIGKDGPSGFRFSNPITGLLPNRMAIPATQRLENKDGKFAGVVLFSIDPARATAMYRRVNLGNSGSILLISSDGIVLFGYTLPRGLDPSVIGTMATNEIALARAQSGPSGSYIATSALDGIERIYSWRRLENFPAIAVVGVGKKEALAAANRQAMRMLALGALSAGLLLTLTIMLNREIARRLKHALALEETNGKLAAAQVDIDERKRHEEQITLLLREVNHRSKNMLAVVQAIARQTVAATPKDFIDRFAERIEALAASQDLLVKNDWKGVDLQDLARSQLGHFKDLVDKRIELRGPRLFVSASAAQTIGMALHELATNAGKYGALSDGCGRVEVDWSLERGGGRGAIFVISWRERGGPPVVAPVRAGFGSIVLCQVAKESLDAKVELNYASTGLVWQLRCPVAEVIDGSYSASMIDAAEITGDYAGTPPERTPKE